ncbi:MAG: RNA-binding transcriptional accessory protein [Clostridia bacterium]|nr:RNA-binding transcriptional accessory protein [Clostridia bacterium]
MNITQTLAEEFQVQPWQIDAVIALLDEGCTIPFIARYRKEQHGELDDQKLRDISDRLTQLRNLEQRKVEISESLKKLDKWTEELQQDIDNAPNMARLEDVYRPFKPKRRTRASIAKEKGLEPLADTLVLQLSKAKTPEELADGFIDPEKGVENAEQALQGAMDIIAERISDDPNVRLKLKQLYAREAEITTEKAKDEDSVYSMYYEDYRERWLTMPGHRVLAINRGEKEGFLKVHMEVDHDHAVAEIGKEYIAHTGSIATTYVTEACEDAYDRLIAPSLENELRSDATDRAQTAAIQVFALNLKPLLMAPPVRGQVAIGLDPGYMHGCKVAVVDATGRVLDTTVVYPTMEKRVEQSKKVIRDLIVRHHVTVAAIGNGTASRETEKFFVEVMHSLPEGTKISYMVVSEAGASVYSASPLAAEEFPQFDVNIRSAISIARRLEDPLAELVKIDPKAIGVGQYQHDLKEAELDAALDHVVEDCVNAVGVDVNTASAALLSHVAGVNNAVAKNIVAYREENGPFSTRSQLKKVPKLGPRAFEQCAGFLRIPGASDLIENTGVHPESYKAAKALLKRFDMDALKAASGALAPLVEMAGYGKIAQELEIGEPTLRDIVKEMSKPGRDPRDELPPPLLRSDVMELKDLTPGMELKGTVRNVVDFGAFVDIGVHHDGLVHISQFGRYIKHPSQAVSVGDVVTVYVLSVDVKKERISLTMVKPGTAPQRVPQSRGTQSARRV